VFRARRVALAVLALAAVFGVGRLVSAWVTERRRKTVFAARDAEMLLNPLRALAMPVGRTLQRFGMSAGQVVLELGPGPGYYSIEASRRVGPHGRLICLDLQPDMIDRLTTRLSAAGVGAETGVADATHLPLKDGCIDVAFLVTVLGEVPDADAALGELHRVLKPGGALGPERVVWRPRLRQARCPSRGVPEGWVRRGRAPPRSHRIHGGVSRSVRALPAGGYQHIGYNRWQEGVRT
jgi:SAM-dependent methyltransferase